MIDNRTIINIGTQIIVSSPDTPRLVEDDDEVIIESLPRGRTRETIVRDNGVQVVTIRNRYGDIIQRSRICRMGAKCSSPIRPNMTRTKTMSGAILALICPRWS